MMQVEDFNGDQIAYDHAKHYVNSLKKDDLMRHQRYEIMRKIRSFLILCL